MKCLPEIAVFRTTVRRAAQVRRLRTGLTELGRWSFDLCDRDRVLRIETTRCLVPVIQLLLRRQGFCCEELPD